jgi:hypothetical protein
MSTRSGAKFFSFHMPVYRIPASGNEFLFYTKEKGRFDVHLILSAI